MTRLFLALLFVGGVIGWGLELNGVAAQDSDAQATIEALQTQVAELENAGSGTPTPVPSPDSTAAEPALGTVNLEIILDVSGSMAQTIGTGETRMEAAKRVLQDVIAGIPDREGINVGLRIYGHLGNNTPEGAAVSCQSSELLVPLDGVAKEALEQQTALLQPTGWTPIALSLQQAEVDFSNAEADAFNYVVLVTDGLETCGGDPCQVAGAIHTGEQSVTTSVVGFALTPDEQAIISCIAEQGAGDVLGAADADELSAALFTVLSTPVPDIVTPIPAPRSAEPGTRESPLPIGTTAEIGGGWVASVVSVTPNANDLIAQTNQFNDLPEPGYQFFLVTIQATYEGEGSSVLPAGNTFSVVGDSSVAYTTYGPGCGVLPDPFQFTDVFEGGTIVGNVCFAVQSSDVDSLVMFSEDFVTFDRDIRVWFALR